MSSIKDSRRDQLAALLEEQAEPRQTNLARLLKRSPAQISQWLSGYRTITEESAREIERNARKPRLWLDASSDWTPEQHANKGPGSWVVAQELSQPPYTDSLLIQWGESMSIDLPPRFRVAAPDDSMAPRVRKGEILEFDRGLTARAGDGVLVRDDAGRCYFRIFRERRPGTWEAAALNPAFQSLDSERDGLVVLAVMTAVFQRWS